MAKRKEAKGQDFIQKPVYEGGISALRRFIHENLRYPEEALQNRTEGTVVVRYDINYKGKVTDVKVISGPQDGCREEAVRLVKLLRFKIPGLKRGLKVTFHRNLQIHFRLPKAAPAPTPPASENRPEFAITYVQQRKPPTSGSGDSYFYTVDL